MKNTFRETFYIDACNNGETAIAATSYYPASASWIDVSQFERFVFMINPGALNTALVCQVTQDTSATSTAVKNITDATVTIGTTDDNETFTIEVATNQLDGAGGFKFVSLYITGASGSDDYAAITFIGYNARTLPVTQSASYPAANAVVVSA